MVGNAMILLDNAGAVTGGTLQHRGFGSTEHRREGSAVDVNGTYESATTSSPNKLSYT